MYSWERIKNILIKEFIQVLRNPRLRLLLFVPPLFQTLVFGYAVTSDVRNISIALYDLDNTPASRELARSFTYSKYFNVKNVISTDREEKDLIDHAAVNAVLSISPGFGREVAAGRTAPVQLIIDGTDSNTAAIILNYAGQVGELYSARIVPAVIKGLPRVDLQPRVWFNENLESRNFYVPGVIALIVTLITLLLSSLSIVREKEIGTIEQLIVSPIRPAELILGKLLPFVLISLLEVTLVTAVAVFWFAIPLRGSLLLLLGATLVYVMTTLGVGLFISTIAKTQQEAMMSVFLFIFPAMLLSGFVYPIANMPGWIQYITYLNPLRYFLVILRGVFLKGSGINILWPSLLVLLVLGLSVLYLSSLRFKKRLS